MPRLPLLALLLSALPVHAAGPPNVVVILSDDQGWGDLSLNGNTNLRTPHLDALGRGGAVLDRFFVQPVCSPTRADLLTGRYHPRGGVIDVSRGGERLNPSERTVADHFRAAGYATGCVGKWHNGSQYPYHPLGRGFDHFHGFTHGHWGDYFDAPLDHDGAPVKSTGYLTDHLTDEAVRFIVRPRQQPFFLWLAYQTPHSPMQVPDPWFARFQNADLPMRASGPRKEDLAFTRAALAMCENLDANVGRLLAALDERKLSENTIVVFLSDNGPNSWRWNGGMRGRKGSTDEGGVRSPCSVRWPAAIQPGTTIPHIAGAIDLLPTLAELCGVPVPEPRKLDGRSLAGLLLGKTTETPDRVLFAHWNGRVSARNQRFRLDADGKLYDLPADPGQQKDVAAAHPVEAEKLRTAVTTWRADVLSAAKRPDARPFPVGYRELPRAELPARDGTPHGGVRRSASAPNDSYFTNWTKPDDRMTWPIEAATAGRYTIEVEYTCPAADVGSEITVRIGDAVVTGSVGPAHDPPLRGAANDRVPRVGESLVKEFRPLKLGEVTLAKGPATLTLSANTVAGKTVADVRGVVVTLTR